MLGGQWLRRLLVSDVCSIFVMDIIRCFMDQFCFLWHYSDGCPANNDPWFHMFCKWIHEFNWLNSREFTGFFEQIWCVDICLLWNHEFFTWWHIPVKPYQFWPSTTRVKLVQNSWQQAEHVYSREYTWKQVLVERYQLWTSMTRANWFRNGSLFAGCALSWIKFHLPVLLPLFQWWHLTGEPAGLSH